MLRWGLLWFQLVGGLAIVGEHLFHIRVTKERGSRHMWGLLVGALLAAIAVLEIFLLEYKVIPEAAVWPTLLVLDVLAIVLYLGRSDALSSGTSSEGSRRGTA